MNKIEMKARYQELRKLCNMPPKIKKDLDRMTKDEILREALLVYISDIPYSKRKSA